MLFGFAEVDCGPKAKFNQDRIRLYLLHHDFMDLHRIVARRKNSQISFPRLIIKVCPYDDLFLSAALHTTRNIPVLTAKFTNPTWRRLAQRLRGCAPENRQRQ